MYFTQSELTLLYSELLAAALRYRYATHKVFTNGALRRQLTHPTQKAVPCSRGVAPVT
ncbi:hypothetical protein PN451_12425 [Dolichospermum planctonicum CS-1226]|uniref:Uncharacterized protein n=1 Tax=Dolichospermum planctonicum CS-1226 TaxID=3021751 RepID=A0ABT5AH57_9CYAN|nr:hypothetical protein [Dolichospermum planctonicum]MDB9536621.1 hypothetical protein [Dolichospermum planctonicum CS-1226]